MNTLTAEKTEKKINFLSGSKIPDWRYETWEHLFTNSGKLYAPIEKFTYWIGVVDLRQLKEDQYLYPIGNRYTRNDIENDRYQKREVDGFTQGWCDIQYDLSAIMEEMIISKNHYGNYFHVFLEEKVNRDGEHSVSILYTEGGDFGVAKTRPWYLEQVKDWIQYASKTVSEEMKRICILHNKPYKWSK